LILEQCQHNVNAVQNAEKWTTVPAFQTINRVWEGLLELEQRQTNTLERRASHAAIFGLSLVA
jgi:hypothetical protein